MIGSQKLNKPLCEQIAMAGQSGVLRFWDELSEPEQTAFAHQMSQVDWGFVAGPRNEKTCHKVSSEHVAPPTHLIHQPRSIVDAADWKLARTAGEAILRAGQVAVVLVAGGLATRLGVSQPKGMFPIGPVTGNSLYQLLAEQVVALGQRYQVSIPYLIMTSDATHDQTVDWFTQHNWFGLRSEDVFVFRQGWNPVFDSATGELMLASKSSLAVNPDGHGGVLDAMSKSGLFAELQRRRIETLFYHQVDNPLVHVCDPAFLGFHARHGADVSTKTVDKRSPDERVGVVVELDGRTEIIEYSDLPEQLASAREADGQLRFRAGNTAIHLFQRVFLERIVTQGAGLPWHRVVRKNSFVDASGQMVQPQHANAVKFERFVFDILPLADTALVVETDREREFAPLKNAEGECSPVEVQRSMTLIAAKRLREVGVVIPDGISVEISPLAAAPDDELILRDDCPRIVECSIMFGANHIMSSAPRA